MDNSSINKLKELVEAKKQKSAKQRGLGKADKNSAGSSQTPVISKVKINKKPGGQFDK